MSVGRNVFELGGIKTRILEVQIMINHQMGGIFPVGRNPPLTKTIIISLVSGGFHPTQLGGIFTSDERSSQLTNKPPAYFKLKIEIEYHFFTQIHSN